MSVQARANISTVPFIRSGVSLTKDSETILTNTAATAVIAPLTIMSKVGASQKWVPLTDVTATDGTAIPQGVYLGAEISAADQIAGDITDNPILVGGSCTVDKDQFVFHNAAYDLNTTITVGTTDIRTIEDHLADRGIFAEATTDIDSFENA